MELRDSGRDLVQIKDDGTHVILPASAHRTVRSNRVGLPVIVLRHSDGKMRRGGSWAASLQHHCPVDDCTAHRDSLLSWRLVSFGSEDLVVTEEGVDNG